MRTTNNQPPAFWVPEFVTDIPLEARQYFNRSFDPAAPVPTRELDRQGYYQACIVPPVDRYQTEALRREVATSALEQIARDGQTIDMPYPSYGKYVQMRQARYRGVTADGMHTLLLLRAWQYRDNQRASFTTPSYDACVAAEQQQPLESRHNTAVAYADVYMAASGYPETPETVRPNSTEALRVAIVLGTQAISALAYYPEIQGSLHVGVDRQRAADISQFISYADTLVDTRMAK